MLTEQEKMSARRHMGYGGVQQASSFALGIPAGVQTAFMIEGSLNRLMPEAEPVFRDIIARLDGIEAQIAEDQGNIAVTKLGSLEINLEEFKQLITQQYVHWQGALANLLQCVPNPYDFRPWLGSGYGGGRLNASVQH